MGADVYLQIMDHLFLMLKVLNNKENGHSKGKEHDQLYDNLKSEAFIKFYLFHFFL